MMPSRPAIREAPTGPVLSHLQGSSLVLLCGVVFSFGGLAFRSTDDVSPWQYLFFRGIGMLLVTGLALLARHRQRLGLVFSAIRGPHVWAALILGGINCLFIIALDLATVAFVLFAQTLGPVAAAYFTWLLTGERVTWRVVAASAVSAIGVGVMAAGTITDELSPWALVTLAIPVGFGLYATIIRSAPPVDPALPILMAGVFVAGLPGVIVLASGGFDLSRRDALIGVFAGSVLLGLPLALFNVAQRVVPSSETTLLLLSEVVLAPLWVWAFADETPGGSTLVGGAIVTAAVVWLTITRRKPPRRVFTTRG